MEKFFSTENFCWTISNLENSCHHFAIGNWGTIQGLKIVLPEPKEIFSMFVFFLRAYWCNLRCTLMKSTFRWTSRYTLMIFIWRWTLNWTLSALESSWVLKEPWHGTVLDRDGCSESCWRVAYSTGNNTRPGHHAVSSSSTLVPDSHAFLPDSPASLGHSSVPLSWYSCSSIFPHSTYHSNHSNLCTLLPHSEVGASQVLVWSSSS